ncbi:MAG: hypothetical protein A2496_13825 [Burkholderiales bacterium RIFOXYC12_FULL_60_6]|nr:MAG: hypothetical protein A2503_02865 [Burkholderiales bacterium RIFOXYD12_FULL_59_19]OGB80638.1 MAG: hypothetical protein A2496_13825 [Burkholderiales bacterium RIFOXYC12_FULL_60_6]
MALQHATAQHVGDTVHFGHMDTKVKSSVLRARPRPMFADHSRGFTSALRAAWSLIGARKSQMMKVASGWASTFDSPSQDLSRTYPSITSMALRSGKIYLKMENASETCGFKYEASNDWAT